ncbi:hypothetical protein WJX73_008082 [Symbiochloris irregularis]|uniref:Uncharacterized protein n=1 Tax=Symbiochloris irregularis TaxID=706552 RepID=A0AAW1NTI3_9CHLO
MRVPGYSAPGACQFGAVSERQGPPGGISHAGEVLRGSGSSVEAVPDTPPPSGPPELPPEAAICAGVFMNAEMEEDDDFPALSQMVLSKRLAAKQPPSLPDKTHATAAAMPSACAGTSSHLEAGDSQVEPGGSRVQLLHRWSLCSLLTTRRLIRPRQA